MQPAMKIPTVIRWERVMLSRQNAKEILEVKERKSAAPLHGATSAIKTMIMTAFKTLWFVMAERYFLLLNIITVAFLGLKRPISIPSGKIWGLLYFL